MDVIARSVRAAAPSTARPDARLAAGAAAAAAAQQQKQGRQHILCE
jgi:hypothetical protein